VQGIERKFKAAAKERIGPGSLKSQKFVEEDIDTIKKLLATAILKVEELRGRRPTA
jgi:formate hydrogenlyase subunit 4